MLINSYLEWRKKEYSVLLIVNRTLSNKAEVALYLMRLKPLVQKLCETYGKKSVSIIVAHTIRFSVFTIQQNPKCTSAIMEWVNSIEPIREPAGFENPHRDFHELVLKLKEKTVLAIAEILISENSFAKESSTCVVNSL